MNATPADICLLDITNFVIRREALEQMKERISVAATFECCGFWIGSLAGSEARVDDVVFVHNLSDRPDSFAVSPQEYREIVEDLDGRAVLAVFHSHIGEARPSSGDLEGMTLHPLPWVIAGGSGAARAHAVDVAVFQYGRQGLREIGLSVEDSGGGSTEQQP